MSVCVFVCGGGECVCCIHICVCVEVVRVVRDKAKVAYCRHNVIIVKLGILQIWFSRLHVMSTKALLSRTHSISLKHNAGRFDSEVFINCRIQGVLHCVSYFVFCS